MSGFSSRVNMSLYLANLNAIPSADEQLVDTFNPDDLALFTNTQFFDFDMGLPLEDVIAASYDLEKDGAIDCDLGGDLDILNDYNPFADYSRFSALSTVSPTADDNHQQDEAAPPTGSIFHTTQVTMIPIHPPTSASATSTSPVNKMGSSSTDTHSSDTANARPSKRKASSPFDASSPGRSVDILEDASRFAAEEDKRRRNTAASARFRIKKKQREQELERTAKEMTERCAKLEQRVNQLEMENKWLKNLIVDKNNGVASKTTTENLSEMFAAKYSATIATARESTVVNKDRAGTNGS